jgi:hypothetical protein
MIMTHQSGVAAPRAAREQRVQRLMEGGDDAAAAQLLGLCAGLSAQKAEVARRILARDPSSADLLPLIRHLDPELLRSLVVACMGNSARAELLLEIARHAPEVVRPHVSAIRDARVLAAARAEAPKEWITPLLEAYEKTGDLEQVRAIGQIRTEAALQCLIGASKVAPAEHLPVFAFALENAGVSPRDRHPSIFFDAFRGYVVSRDESPHHMGPGFPYAVPLCLFCQTPAERLVTLDAGSLESFELEVNPTFFWYRCACDTSDHILVRNTDDGLEGVMTAMTDAPVTSSLLASSLFLEAFPRTSIVGGPARPGAGEHQMGGYPVWIEERRFPIVPGAPRSMGFVGSVDLAATPLGWSTEQRGIVYCFFDHESRISVSLRQVPP